MFGIAATGHVAYILGVTAAVAAVDHGSTRPQDLHCSSKEYAQKMAPGKQQQQQLISYIHPVVDI